MPRRGPRTEAGKAAIAAARTTHGLRTTSVVLPGVEDEAEWKQFYDDMHQSVAPLGPAEASLVDRIAAIFWRLRRVPRAEQQIYAAAREKEEVMRRDNRRSARDVPLALFDGPALDQLIRYEAQLNRQLMNAIHDLESLQARRPGNRTLAAFEARRA